MKRVLFVVDTLEVGGSEKSMLEMLPYLSGIQLFVCHLYPGHHLKEKYEAAKVPVYSLNLPGKYGFSRGYRALSQLIDEIKPDIVHSALLRSSLLVRVVRWRKRFCHVSSLVADSYHPVRIRQMPFAIRCKFFFFYWLDRLTANQINVYIANSEAIKRNNVKYLKLGPDRVKVIYRGRNAELFNPDERAKKKGSTFICLTVGRLVQSKGHRILVEAFANPLLRGKSIELWLAGDGPERLSLEREISAKGLEQNIKLLGRTDRVHELLRNADLFLFPSQYEGLGGAIIEAMMAGLPTVCSELPVFKELIEADKTGRFAPLQPAAWAKEINFFFTQREEGRRMGANAREVAVTRFDIQRIAAEYKAFYYSV